MFLKWISYNIFKVKPLISSCISMTWIFFNSKQSLGENDNKDKQDIKFKCKG